MTDPFYLLDPSVKTSLMILLLLSFAGCVAVLIVSSILKRGVRHTLPLLAFVLFLFVDLVFLSENTSNERIGFSRNPLTIFTRQPVILVYLTTFSALIVFLFGALRNHRKLNNTLTGASVKEALDTLPLGIVIASESGTPLLTNQLMAYLCSTILGHNLNNALTFANELRSIKSSEGITRINLTSELAVKIPDGRVFRFVVGVINISGVDYIEIKATDISELYQLSRQKLHDIEQLGEQQYRLRELLEVIVDTNREEEVLASKMHIHDSLGSCTLATRKYLKAREKSGDIPASLVEMWEKVVHGLTVITPEEEDSSIAALGEINNIADSLGCRIILEGNLPNSGVASGLLRAALRTTLSNAVRHAGADLLTVSIDREKSGYRVNIANNGRPPAAPVIEGGGLSSLRNRIEQAGGTMELIECQKCGMKLNLYLPE